MHCLKRSIIGKPFPINLLQPYSSLLEAPLNPMSAMLTGEVVRYIHCLQRNFINFDQSRFERGRTRYVLIDRYHTGRLNSISDKNSSMINSMINKLTSNLLDKKSEKETWERLNKCFVTEDVVEGYVKYFMIIKQILLKDPQLALKFIKYLHTAKHIDRNMSALFKELVTTTVEDLIHKSVTERDIDKSRLIHKLLIGQKQWSLAKHVIQTIVQDGNRLLKDSESASLCNMLCDMLETMIVIGEFEDYFEIRKKFSGKVNSKRVGSLLLRLLTIEKITLDVYMELMLNEHYILTESQSSLVQGICDRTSGLLCTAVKVDRQRGTCPNCSIQLKKDEITPSEFNSALRDFVQKMADCYMESELSTQYFESLRNFIRINGPFHYFIDMANISAGNAPNEQVLKTVKVLPANKKICVIKSENCGALAFPRNVGIFNVHSYSFKGQDDILLLLGILLNGPETVLISNDSYRDHFLLLRDDVQDTMLKWQRIHQQPYFFNEKYDVVLFPKLFSRTTQRDRYCWHIPYMTKEMSRHDAAFFCVQYKDWETSNTVLNIQKAKSMKYS